MKLFKKSKKEKEDISLVIDNLEREETIDSIRKKESCLNETLMQVNNLLQYMTNLDYVKNMVLDARKQSDMIAATAANSEEMAASTEEISSYVQESSSKIQSTMKETRACISQVGQTFDTIEKNIEEIDVAKDLILKVQSETDKIKDMVTVIKSVADRTNLLSLNASIEAARAGEHGRGFAIVAEEIKKLSENTKEQVGFIQKTVVGLNENIETAAREMQQIVNAFSGSKISIENASGGMGLITRTMEEVNENLLTISANVEEQSAATEEISANLQSISEKSIYLGEEADRTGKAFFDISMKADKARITAYGCNENLDSISMIEISITDHMMWKWRVYNMIMGYITLDISAVGDHHGCRLGKWIETLDCRDTKVKTIIDQIEFPHAEIHNAAKTAIQEYTKGNLSIAEHKLAEIEKNSATVVALLNELKKVL